MSGSIKLKDISEKEILLAPGHRMCSGCGAGIVAKMVLLASDYPMVACSPTGCLEVTTCISDYTSWKIPWIHSAFENAAATISGVERMHQVLVKKGKVREDIKFIVFAGDGGTYDIGFQSLSGTMERGHDILYICYDNEAYMNTGTQRSSASPLGADTSTSPAGSVIPGKSQHRKNMTRIMAEHNIPYSAQASPSHYNDLMKKIKKALEIKGPKFINIIAPCNRGWRSKSNDAIELSKIAVDSCYWPLYEIEDGKVTVNYTPKEKRPVEDFLKPQGRFSHLFEEKNMHMIDQLQKHIDNEWSRLLQSC